MAESPANHGVPDRGERDPGTGPGEPAWAHSWSLFDNMHEGLAHCRMEFADGRPVDWVYLSVNPAFGELTGLQDAAGRHVSELIPGIHETNPELLEIYGRVAAGGHAERFESWVPELERWFDVSVFSPAAGEFVALFVIVNQRKKAEEALRASEARCADLVRGLPVGVFTVHRDADGVDRFAVISPRAAWILGIDHESIQRDATELWGVFDEAYRDRMKHAWDAMFDSPGTAMCQWHVRVRGEHRMIRVVTEPALSYGETTVRHGFVEDVTSR